MIRRLLCWLNFHKFETCIVSIHDGIDNNLKPIFRDCTAVICKHCGKVKK